MHIARRPVNRTRAIAERKMVVQEKFHAFFINHLNGQMTHRHPVCEMAQNA
jgi:hypothetical protein